MVNITTGTKAVFSDKDYHAGEIIIPKARTSFVDNKEQFNQSKLDKYGCCYHAGYGCVADNCVYELDNESILKELEQTKYSYGYEDGLGMYIYKAVDMVRKTVNKYLIDDEIITCRIELGSKMFYDILDQGYSVHTLYKGNKAYNKDKSDGVLDNTEFGKTTYGHSVRIGKIPGLCVIDNYYQGKDIDKDDNVYELKDLEGLIKNGVYIGYGYIYIFKKDIMTQLDEDVKMIEYAIEHGITKNQQNLEDVKKGNYTVDVRMALMNARVHKDLSDRIRD